MKRILVTGATSGIGRATALRLATPDTEVIITGRRMDRLEALKAEIEAKGAKCMVLNFDVRSEAECIEHLTPLGRVDILINNAGLAAGLEHIDRGDSRDWDAMIDTNVKGLLYVTKIISHAMVEAGKGGHIINIGSIAGTEPYENGAVYCASKHAVHAISQAMRADLLSAGIKMKLKQLVAAMLNYGAQAQLFFGHNTDNLANATLTDEQKALPEAYRTGKQ